MTNRSSGVESTRPIVVQLEQEFAGITTRLRELVASVSPENVLRSAAAIEQIGGGITANLWDDPFEWTLPETLSTPQLILAYIAEVDATRARAFSSIQADSDLLKYVAAPSGESRTLLSMLLEALLKAHRYEERAQLAAKSFSPQGQVGLLSSQ
jgi:hypothetical protein